MKQWWMLGLGLALVAVAAACGGRADVANTTVAPERMSTTIPMVASDEALAALSAARDRWAAAAPEDYTVSVQTACDDCADEPQTVAVRDGDVVSLSDPDEPTVDGVFETIERSIGEGADVEVEYDPDLGYPRRVRIDLDRDGDVDLDLAYDDLQAMPIVRTLEELLVARERWESQGFTRYRYIFRADCTCPTSGTWDVTVDDGAVDYTPLDDGAAATSLTPGDFADAFYDLEDWFTSSAEFIELGILDVDVRMDPALGYPRWFRIQGAGIDEGFDEPFTLIVTMDLVSGSDTGREAFDGDDGQDLIAAYERWQRAALRNYSHTWTRHCECDLDVRGPFRVEVVDREVVAVTRIDDDTQAELSSAAGIDEAFELISRTIADGVEVTVEYHPVLGHPMNAILDPEAAAVDGGYMFSVDDLGPAGDIALVVGTVTSGPQCPVQSDPPQPGCEDKPVSGAPVHLLIPGREGSVPVSVAADGTFVLDVVPGEYVVVADPVEGLLGTPAPLELTIGAGEVRLIELVYDTGMR